MTAGLTCAYCGNAVTADPDGRLRSATIAGPAALACPGDRRGHDTEVTIDHDRERDLSYWVRREIGIPEGRDGTGEARTLREISNYPAGHPEHRSIPAGTLCRVRTSNAGFRGIECSATPVDGGPTVHGVSLGAFEP